LEDDIYASQRIGNNNVDTPINRKCISFMTTTTKAEIEKFKDGGMKKAASPKNDEAAKFCPLGTIQFCTGI